MKKRSGTNVRFLAVEKSDHERAKLEMPTSFSDAEPDEADIAELARAYFGRVLELNAQAFGLSFGSDDEPMPTADVSGVQRSKLSSSSVVRFTQTVRSIPIFGSDVVVEIDANGKLVGVQAALASIEDTSATPTLEAEAAKARLAEFAGLPSAEQAPAAEPTLTFFSDEADDPNAESGAWRLAWLFRGVRLARPDEASHGGHRRAHAPSPRTRAARHDVLVDAHDGRILFHYSTTPCARAASAGALPVRCRGTDGFGKKRDFFATSVDGGFELYDPQRKVKTFDFGLGDISRPIDDIPLPASPVRDESATFSGISPAAVAAHVNVSLVWDFYTSVLQRDSVDDAGMELVSVVNCTSSEDLLDESADRTQWDNAIWWEGRMWYGQTKDAAGAFHSYATRLDIIGHELTHGVTERTAGLVYQGQSGALNESFSDIMGIFIVNWSLYGVDSDVSRWTWVIGPGCGEDGGPLRDMSDPKRTGDPAHMRDFVVTREDAGGVHSNSNIHNKAAHNLLTAVGPDGQPELTPREVAILYYLCLVRLPKRANFSRALSGLLDVATTYYAGDPKERERKLRAIKSAYKKVGIEREEG